MGEDLFYLTKVKESRMKICTHPSIPLPTDIHEVPAGKCAVKLWEVNLKFRILISLGYDPESSELDSAWKLKGWSIFSVKQINHLLRGGELGSKAVSSCISRMRKCFK